MAKVEDGGPAFPLISSFYGDDSEPGDPPKSYSHVYSEGGMSLRDYFAAKALNAMLQNAELCAAMKVKYGQRVTPFLADAAYEFANAMIESREK